MSTNASGYGESVREKSRVETVSGAIAASYEGAGDRLLRFAFDGIRPWLQGVSCLELGPATGHETRLLRPIFEDLVAVDGSSDFVTALTAEYEADPGVTVVEALFEEYSPERAFDCIVAAHVLEHVEDPDMLLGKCREWCKPDGRLILQVPNARSFHRLAGVALGQLATPYELNDRDVMVGHRRVYDQESLSRAVEDAGFRILDFRGSFAKFLSDGQMNEVFTAEMFDAYNSLGEQFQENAANISVLAVPA